MFLKLRSYKTVFGKINGNNIPLSLIKSIGVDFSIVLLGYILQFLLNSFLTHHLSVSDYGLYSTLMAAIMTVSFIALCGNDEASIRFLPQYLNQKQDDKLLGAIIYYLAVIVIISIATALIINIVNHYLLQVITLSMEDQLILRCLWIIPVYALLELLTTVLRGLQRVYISVVTYYFLFPLFTLIILILLNHKFHHLLSLKNAIEAFIFACLLVIIIQVATLFKSLQHKLAQRAILTFEVKTWFTVGVQLLLTVTLFFMQQSMLSLLLKATHHNAQTIACYNVVYLVASSLWLFSTANGSIIGPSIAPAAKNNDVKTLQKLANTGLLVTVIPGLALYFVFVLWGKPILGHFGEAYRSGYDALLVLSLGNIIGLAMCTPMYLLEYAANTALLVKVTLVGFTCVLGISVAFCYFWGLVGAAASTVLLEISFLIIFSYLLRTRIGIKLFSLC
jgi:O-antigen/teichoic acid export membrane protein